LRYKINDEAKLEVPKVNVLQNPFYQEIKVHPILAGIIQGTQLNHMCSSTPKGCGWTMIYNLKKITLFLPEDLVALCFSLPPQLIWDIVISWVWLTSVMALFKVCKQGN
jgi:hypothetical protein